MEVFTKATNRHDLPTATVVAIGNFDGVHLGHQKILSELVKTAKEQKLMSMVLTFEPHPGKVTGKGRIKLIQTLEQKLEKISKSGADAVYIQDFDDKLAGLPGKKFITDILLNILAARIIIVGENFRFGKNRSNDISSLRAIAAERGFKVFTTPSVIINGEMISSSFIRSLILNGEIQKANTLLGDDFTIKGRVIKGSSRGTKLGFPTANIKTENEILPPGIFITQTFLAGKTYRSVCNIGSNPTFGKNKIGLEAHILDFNKNLYEQDISLAFLKKIRDEIRFATTTELQAQIERDIKTAEDFFKINLI